MNPIEIDCPQCRAKPGEKCRNYLGNGCAFHRERMKRAEPEPELDRQDQKTTHEPKTLFDEED